MRFVLSVAMCPVEELVELAVLAEEYGFSAVALPDSLFYPEKVSHPYPYTVDGSRFWAEETPWPDPLIAASVMATATKHIRFFTSVLKLGSRHPIVLARQLATVAALSRNRFGLGVGVGWNREEAEWCGVPFENRGRRADEFLEVIRLILGGGMVSYQGEFFAFDKLRMVPVPTEPVPVYIGGHADGALRRAARIGDGWATPPLVFEDMRVAVAKMTGLLAEYGRDGDRFDIQAICLDNFGPEGYRKQAEIGVTDSIVTPWLDGWPPRDVDLQAKRDAIKRFADENITAPGSPGA